MCCPFLLINLRMLRYKVTILHASLYICITFYFVGDTVTATTIGFPAQLSLLHLNLQNIQSLRTIQYLYPYSSSKFIDFINIKNDFRCFIIISYLLTGQFPDFNLLKTKRNLLYIRNQSVPRS